jgi:hypothetical protein
LPFHPCHLFNTRTGRLGQASCAMLKVHAKLRGRAGHVRLDWTMGRLSCDYSEPLHTVSTMARQSCTAARATKSIMFPNDAVEVFLSLA